MKITQVICDRCKGGTERRENREGKLYDHFWQLTCSDGGGTVKQAELCAKCRAALADFLANKLCEPTEGDTN